MRHFLHSLVILAVSLWISSKADDLGLDQIGRCLGGNSRDYHGYTYDMREGKRWWSHCHFPSPVSDQMYCGRPTNYSHRYYLCDPDQILTREEGFEIDSRLYRIQAATPTQCEDLRGRKENFTVGVVLIDKLRVGNLNAEDTCINLCGNIIPEVNVTLRQPTERELYVTSQNFANNILSSWRLGRCQNDVIVFYSQQHQILATAVSQRASVLTPEKVKLIQDGVIHYFRDGRVKEGLVHLLQGYQSTLQGFTPAHALLVINFVVMALFVCFLGYIYTLGQDVGETYDDTWIKKGLRRVTYLVTGLWFVEIALVSIARMQQKNRSWVILVVLGLSFLIFLVLFAVVGTEKRN